MHSRLARSLRSLRALVVVLAGLALVTAGAGSASAADSHALISGSGSSWSSNAINQWIADVNANGLQVVYTGSGSAIGRKDFANKTTDFGVSEIGYQGVDPRHADGRHLAGQGVRLSPAGRGWHVVPIQPQDRQHPGGEPAAVRQDARRDLHEPHHQLGGPGDHRGQQRPQAAEHPDHPGRALGGLRLDRPAHEVLQQGVPVDLEPVPRARRLHRVLPAAGPADRAERLRRGHELRSTPRRPTARSATTSTRTRSTPASPSPRSRTRPATSPSRPSTTSRWPCIRRSSTRTRPRRTTCCRTWTTSTTTATRGPIRCRPTRYMIIPTSSTDTRMTTAKRQTLADFLYYSVCDGQKEMGPIGYSPLPVNLCPAASSRSTS